MQYPIYHLRFLKPILLKSIEGMKKNTPSFINLIAIATDYLSSLISFSNCDYKTVDYIIVKYEATNMTSGTGNYRTGTDIDSETA